jgi:hypothetical protein
MVSVSVGAPVRPQFFARSALIMLVMVLLAFPFTYFGPVVAQTQVFSPVHHIHGALFFAWIGLYAWQTRLVATGRTARHRELGLAGIAISAMMLPLGIILAIKAIERRMAEGDAHPFDFTIYNIVDITTFTLMMVAGIACVTRSIDWHRRFMFGAALSLVGPAVSRWFLPSWFVTIPQWSPWTDMAPNLTADLFLIALACHDVRTLGRVHPATWIVVLTLVPIHVLTPFIAGTDAWRAIAPALLRLG